MIEPHAGPRVALVYDFDGTLARGNLQERRFIPEIGMTPKAFWEEVKARTKAEDADEILIYMMLMVEKAAARGPPISRDMLARHGEAADLFDGLADGGWFTRIDKAARDLSLGCDHYVISSGIDEMIRGCPIYDRFRRVYASSYAYGADGNAIWPKVAINYTTKTQFLFRINKGIETVWDNTGINAWIPEEERPMPFKRMIFIGDGETDIPSMKLVTEYGGHSIAVYDPNRAPRDIAKVDHLIAEKRVDFVAPADYTENATLDILVRGILGRIARAEGYRP